MCSSHLPSFLSSEPKEGDPPYSWEDIKRPKLRRYPNPLSTLTWKAHLGRGADGVVLQATTAGGDFVAVKIVSRSDSPVMLLELMDDEFLSNTAPVAPEGGRCYWPFERECRNSAILEMLTTSLRHASADGRSILVNPEPVTRRDALRNLRAFAADRSGNQAPSHHHQPVNLVTEINSCLGWTTIHGRDANRAIYTQREIPVFLPDETYFIIVYHYVPEEELKSSVIQAQLDFFYHVGFTCTPVQTRNWRGQGILVDFSDLVSPHALEWEAFTFGRLVKSEDGFYYIERRSSRAKP